jgi:4-carboxymuconolactone decarboxylase
MRLPTLPPDRLTPEQRALYDRNRRQIAHGFGAFTTAREDGALLGPWGVFLHEPPVGQAHYDLIDALTEMKRLSPSAKQVAIIVVGARFNAAYELYAHAATAAAEGMDPARIATLAAGIRPLDLSPEEACAFDVATALLGGGVLPGATYRAARDLLGQGALNELVLWIATYAQVAITLNAFDVPSEETFDR